MGTWGSGLYQDDMACCIKDEYMNRLSIGQSNIVATQEMIKENHYLIQDNDDCPIFWFALADVQWRYGRLLPEVKDKAIKHIQSGIDLERWKDNKVQYNKRKQVLKSLLEKLNSPQPVERKVPTRICHKSIWKNGDILLYQLNSNKIAEHKWYKKYILLKVVGKVHDEILGLPKEKYYDEYDVVKIYNWIGKKAIDIEQINKLNFLQENKFLLNRGEYVDDIMYILDFKDKQLKKLNVTVLYNTGECSNQTNCIMNNHMKGYLHFLNADINFIGSLSIANKRGILIDETKQ